SIVMFIHLRHRPSSRCFDSRGAYRRLHSFPTRRSSDLTGAAALGGAGLDEAVVDRVGEGFVVDGAAVGDEDLTVLAIALAGPGGDRKSTRLNSSHVKISYAVFCLKKKSAASAESRTWL